MFEDRDYLRWLTMLLGQQPAPRSGWTRAGNRLGPGCPGPGGAPSAPWSGVTSRPGCHDRECSAGDRMDRRPTGGVLAPGGGSGGRDPHESAGHASWCTLQGAGEVECRFIESIFATGWDMRAARRTLDRRRSPVLTIMVTEVVDFPRAGELYGTSYGRRLLNEHDRIVEILIEKSRDGRVLAKHCGAFMVVFSRPSVAVRTALNIQRGFRLYNAAPTRSQHPIKVRVGLHIGEFIAESETGWAIFMQHVHLAAQIMRRAVGGQVLMSQSVYEAARMWLELEPGSHCQWLARGRYEPDDGSEAIDIIEVCEARAEGSTDLQAAGDGIVAPADS